MWRYVCIRYLPTYLLGTYLTTFKILRPDFNVCLGLLQFCCHSCFVFFPIPSFCNFVCCNSFLQSLCLLSCVRACVRVCLFCFFPSFSYWPTYRNFVVAVVANSLVSRFVFVVIAAGLLQSFCFCCCCNSLIAFFSSSSSRDSIQEVSLLSRSDLSLFHHCVYCWIVNKNRPGGWQDRRERERRRERITPPSCFSILFLASAPMKWWTL